MFEAVVGTVLSKFLGDYVEGLEGRNLEVNILSGHVVLENLQLKKEAFSRCQLPITIKDGYLGKLALDIPWKSLGKKPVRVQIENIYLIAKPTQPSDYDPNLVEESAQKSKKRRLELSEAIQEEEEEEKDSGNSPKQKSYTQRLIDSATSLFNIEIKNVHFRYEDNVSQKDSQFALGITLENLHATTIEQSASNSFIQKFEAEMNNLALYWNGTETSLKYKNPSEMGDVLGKLIYRSGKSNNINLNYILNPVCGSMNLQLNKKLDWDLPKIIASLIFPKINLSLHEEQYKQILYFSEYFTFFSRGIKVCILFL